MNQQKTNQTSNINAQDGNAVLLSTEHPILGIFNQFDLDWSQLGDDPQAKLCFIKNEVTALESMLLRWGRLIHKIDSEKLYKSFNCKDTCEFLCANTSLSKTAVSRFRTAYSYALPISQTIPALTVSDLNEGQMRQLRKSVKDLHPDLKKEKQVEKAVELYAEIYKETPLPKSSDIREFFKRKIAGTTSGKSNDEKAKQPSVEIAELCSSDNGMPTTDEDELANIDATIVSQPDDFIGAQLAAELAELLRLLLAVPFLDDEIKDRLDRAFEELQIEPAENPEYEGDDYE